MLVSLSVTNNKSLDFDIFRMLANIFDTFSQVIIKECSTAFNPPLATDIRKRAMYFLVRYCASDNLVCKVFASNAERKHCAWIRTVNCLSQYIMNNVEVFIVHFIYYFSFVFCIHICYLYHEIKFYLIPVTHTWVRSYITSLPCKLESCINQTADVEILMATLSLSGYRVI